MRNYMQQKLLFQAKTTVWRYDQMTTLIVNLSAIRFKKPIDKPNALKNIGFDHRAIS